MNKHDRIAEIIRSVCTRHRVTAEQMFGPRLSKQCAAARMEAMYRVRTEMRLSTTQVGAIFRRDHSTVVDGCKKVRKYIEQNGEWPCYADPTDEPFDVGPISFKSQPGPKIGRPKGSVSKIVKPISQATGAKALKARMLADRINSYWAQQGVEANARPVWQGGRVVVQSDLRLGAA